jgi:hypothetical protein
MEEDEVVEENGCGSPVKKDKTLDSDMETETPTLMNACG